MHISLQYAHHDIRNAPHGLLRGQWNGGGGGGGTGGALIGVVGLPGLALGMGFLGGFAGLPSAFTDVLPLGAPSAGSADSSSTTKGQPWALPYQRLRHALSNQLIHTGLKP